MATAPDGSPIDVYLRLPERGEGLLVAEAIAPPAALLELGCGTGRVTRQLTRLGYEVVAGGRVAGDARARSRRPDRVRTYRKARPRAQVRRRPPAQQPADGGGGPAALIPRHLPPSRRTARRRVAAAGLAADRERVAPHRPRRGQRRARRGLLRRGGSHTFAMRVFADRAELDAALADGGFAFDRWIDPPRGWFVARAV